MQDGYDLVIDCFEHGLNQVYVDTPGCAILSAMCLGDDIQLDNVVQPHQPRFQRGGFIAVVYGYLEYLQV